MTTTALTHSAQMTGRHLRAISRQPGYLAITLIQPFIWLLLFGALFKKIVEIPGFATTSYINFLTPGIAIMTALFSAGWTGMGLIEDLNRGVMDRFLVSPVRRGAIISGRLTHQALMVVVQAVIILGLGWVAGARWGNPAGLLVLVAAMVLLSSAFSALSDALALTVRKDETLIAATQFVMLPATFLSATFMQLDLAPGWIQAVARFNPVNWAVEAGREVLVAAPDWGFVGLRMGGLLVLAVACGSLATRAFRSYQRSI
jgi:ABC-2 type transport system permease protein